MSNHYDKPVIIRFYSAKKNSPNDCEWIDDNAPLPNGNPLFLVLSFKSNDNWLNKLQDIRRIPHLRLTPVFYEGDIDEKSETLFDGSFNKQSFDIAHQIQERILLIPSFHTTGDNFTLRLLSYLFTRPDVVLRGYLDHQTAYIFNYPLLNLLISQDTFDGWHFLESLVQHDFLIHHQLNDEIQTCPHCDSGLLNFKNCCPNCHSIHIKPQKFIHCLTCGHIGAVATFLRQDRMTCEQCHSKLRQIGIDYEKPIEDKLCEHCGFYFQEPVAHVICLVCEKTLFINELHPKQLMDYHITKQGEYMARGIEKYLHQHAGNFFNFVDFSSFMAIINWQIKLAQRNEDAQFYLLSLIVENEQKLVTEKGLMATEKLLGQFFTKVRQLLRDTDLATRDQGLTIFFLPLTTRKGIIQLSKRILAFLSPDKSELNGIEIKLSAISSREIVQHELNSDLLIIELSDRSSQFIDLLDD